LRRIHHDHESTIFGLSEKSGQGGLKPVLVISMAMSAAIDHEIKGLARWLALDLVLPGS
jgi:hypothetical protein